MEEYRILTDKLIESLRNNDLSKVSDLLDARSNVLKVIEESGDMLFFKEKYKNSDLYKKDLDIEYTLSELKNTVLKELEDFKKFKDGNMAYISTLRDGMQLFVAKV